MRIDVIKAQSVLLGLIKCVAAGKKVVITKDGKPVARLVPANAVSGFRELGSAKGEFTVPDDFNDPLPKEIEDAFWK
jgi:prevent-host-death family protein